LDVTEFWPVKLAALKKHASQIGDPAILEKNQLERRTADSSEENPRFEDLFRRLYKR
jgi:LmbE family N-acetylglucosaminyl deacetylase